MKRQFRILRVILVTTLCIFSRPQAVNAATTPVTVTIWRLVQIDDPDSGKPTSISGDFFARVQIDSFGFQSSSEVSFDTGIGGGVIVNIPITFEPFWTFTQDVEQTNGTAQIEIQIWDGDNPGFPLFDDHDQVDVGPAEGDRTLNLTLDLATGNWSGDVPLNQGLAQGEGDGDRANIFFTISTQSASGDADEDFLLDGWETRGYDDDGDGIIDVDLAAMGANSLRKDLFLEIDCLVAATHTHCPLQAAIQDVVQAFANAPVINVDGSTGIQLHIDVGTIYGQPALPSIGFATNVARTEAPAGSVTGTFGNFGGGGNQIPEAGNEIVDFDGAAGDPATNFYSLKSTPGNNFSPNRAFLFRYFLFVHQVNARAAENDCTSGWAEGGVWNGANTPGTDGIVSLGGLRGNTGNPCWDVDAGGNSVGSRRQQAGVLLHEFGHNLSLDHGGNDIVNNKPNYLSVMNYTFWDCSVTAVAAFLPGGCDFSRIPLPDLNEVFPPGLDECAGLGGGLGLGPVNWDGDVNAGGIANFEGATCTPPTDNVQANINNDTSNDMDGDEFQDPGEPPIFSNLTGFEDWNNLRYDFRNASSFANGSVPPFPDEPTPEMVVAAQEAFAEMVAPTLAVEKRGPVHTIPGDTLTYTIWVQNIGDGPSLNTTMTDTLPDSNVTVFNLGTVIATATVVENDSFTVSCTTADLTVIQNVASVTGEDMLGNFVSGSDTVQTTVHAPVPTLVKTATAAVNAGEAITYSITYENTGSGDATNVVLTDHLPAGVYYNQALDLGTGVQPATVTENEDGTQTLTWHVGNLASYSGPQTIIYTARPTLLFLGGESLSNTAHLNFQNANGCLHPELTASAKTTITVVTPTRDPKGPAYWRNHSSLWTKEILARIQATDQRYDTNGDGVLSDAEIDVMLASGGKQPQRLKRKLLAVLFNLATRRINAATLIESKLTDQLELDNVADAAIYGMDTIALPLDSATRPRYDNVSRVLDMINNNRIENY